MNIRAMIYGGGTSANDESILRDKKPKGAKADALDSVAVAREEARTTDGRFEDRHRLLDETVQVGRGKASREVQLINLSGGGAMICGDLDLKLWDKVELSLGEDGTIECIVRWLRDDRFGLEFAHETRIDCGADEQAAILREVIRRSFPDVEFDADYQPEPDHSGPEARTERRHPLVWSGVLHHDYQSTPVRLRNVSETGAMIECPERLMVGSEPLLELGDALSISATVAWVLGDQAGLRFSTPFNLHELARSRPEVAKSNWEAPSYLGNEATNSSPWAEHWGRSSLADLRQDLEGFMKR
jgi:hypothetical protein